MAFTSAGRGDVYLYEYRVQRHACVNTVVNLGFRNRRGIHGPTERPLSVLEGFCSMEIEYWFSTLAAARFYAATLHAHSTDYADHCPTCYKECCIAGVSNSRAIFLPAKLCYAASQSHS